MNLRADYSASVGKRQLLRDLRDAEADLASGRTHTTTEVREFVMKQKIKSRARRRKGA